MIKQGNIVKSVEDIDVTIKKKVKGKVIKVEEQAFGIFVYFQTEEGQIKCFKEDNLIKID